MIWTTASGPIDLTVTAIMGILNVTPDSFSDGGQYDSPAKAVARISEMIAEGADIIDIGGQSTRPGHTPVTAAEEWKRLSTVLPAAVACGVPVSVDTYDPTVAERALAAGAAIINDVSGAVSERMLAAVAGYGAGYVYTFHDAAAGDPVERCRAAFAAAREAAARYGLPAANLCLDIGVGFHPTREDDLALIHRLGELTAEFSEHPILVGASRKRVTDPAGLLLPTERLSATVALHTVAQLGGAHILRVHDVAAAKQAASAIDRLKGVL